MEVYTHSIPWAMHTKSIAKENRKPDSLIGNRIDWFMRNMQDGQTMGIPVGPDISRVVSEIIATHIDLELEKQLGSLQGIRVVDDYSLYFKELSDLEKARSYILKLLRDIELDLNQAKEKLILLPEIIESEWYNRLRQFKFRNKKALQTKDIRAYFDISFHYSAQFPEDAVLAYSISKICATVFRHENWLILESLLLKSLQVEPKVLPYVVKLFISHKEKGYILTTDLICNTLNEFLLSQLRLENHFEIAWTLWLLKLLELPISNSTAVELSKSTNSVVILVTLDLNESGLISTGLDTSEWEKLMTRENLYTEHWLLAYEAAVKGWLEVEEEYIEADPFFNALKENSIRFYNDSEEIDLSSIKVASEKISLAKYKSAHDDDEDMNSVSNRSRDLRRNIYTPKYPNPDIDWDDI